MRYLERVGGVYRVRVRIPKDVKRHFNQAEIRKSLHTTRFSQAKMLMYNLLSETERIFTMIRSGVLSDDMIRKIVADYLDQNINSFERQRSGEGNDYLLVTPTGGKLWRLQYRFDGKQKMLSFGAYPAISLADARQRREDAKKLLANEVDAYSGESDQRN